jgi:hypothetical protein
MSNFSSRLPVFEDTFDAPMLSLFLVMNDLLPTVGNNELPLFDGQIVGERCGEKHFHRYHSTLAVLTHAY